MDEKIKEFDFTPLEEIDTQVVNSQITYYNENQEEVSKEQGKFIKITEYDIDGNVIRDVWGTYENQMSSKTK